MVECKSYKVQVDQKYGPNRGQRARVDRITLSRLLLDFTRAVLQIDWGIFYNFSQLLKRPEPAIQDFLSGKRKPFFHPASYLLLALVLNYVVVRITNLHFYDEHELVLMDPLSAQAIRDYDAMQWWFLEHTYLYILLAIPASALFLFLIFRLMKHRFNIAETIFVILFTIAQGVLMQSILYLAFGWIKSGPFLRGLETFNICLLTLYASWVVYQLISSVRLTSVRVLMGLIGGIGLTVTWVASALLLYKLLV